MSRSQLHDGEIALLGKLNRESLELGDLPHDMVERLTRLGLARKVLGYCEITRAGQLTYRRDHYRKRSLGRIAPRNPLSLFRRRTIDTRTGNSSGPGRWMTRLSNTAGKNIGK